MASAVCVFVFVVVVYVVDVIHFGKAATQCQSRTLASSALDMAKAGAQCRSGPVIPENSEIRDAVKQIGYLSKKVDERCDERERENATRVNPSIFRQHLTCEDRCPVSFIKKERSST